MKIYTKSGDQGETGLLGGVRVSKSHLAIRTCGALDETNSCIGLARSAWIVQIGNREPDELVSKMALSNLDSIDRVLTQIQHDLFDLGSQVADCMNQSQRPPEFPETRALDLERSIDQYQGDLPELTAFILPSGNQAGSTLHLARSVCRRAEQELVELIGSGVKRELASELIYLNRLGDLLFVMARIVNLMSGSPETTWNVGRQNQTDA